MKPFEYYLKSLMGDIRFNILHEHLEISRDEFDSYMTEPWELKIGMLETIAEKVPACFGVNTETLAKFIKNIRRESAPKVSFS